jgi:hypothetical protein
MANVITIILFHSLVLRNENNILKSKNQVEMSNAETYDLTHFSYHYSFQFLVLHRMMT